MGVEDADLDGVPRAGTPSPMEEARHHGRPMCAWHATVRRWPVRRTRPSVEDVAWDERELVLRAQQDDIDAFSTLVRKHQDGIYRLTTRMVGVDAAEDLAQGAFLKAWQQIGSFAGEAAFGTWVYRIAANLCLDHLRKTARVRHLPLENLAETLPDGDDVSEIVVGAAEQEERRLALNRALAELPGEDRLLLAMRVGDELSYAEIADLLAINPSTVGTRLYRARARLHRLVSRYMKQDEEENDGLR